MAIFSQNQDAIDIKKMVHGIETLNETMKHGNETMKQDSFHYLYIGTIINNIMLIIKLFVSF